MDWWRRLRGGRPSRRAVIVTAVVVGVVVAGGSVAVLVNDRAAADRDSLGVSVASPAAPPAGAYDYESGYESSSGSGESAPAPASGDLGKDSVAQGGVGVGSVQRDLVRSAQLTLDVDDPATRTRQVRTAAAAVGGIVVAEQSGSDSSYLTLRVPADSLDQLVDDIAGLGTVVDRSAQVADATEEVVDLNARVRSQQASVDRIRALLAQATSIGDIVSIESELADREAELDSLTARLAALTDQVALSTLTVDMRGPGVVVPPVEDPTPTGFTDGLAAGWAGLLAVGTAAAAVAGFVLPLLPLVAVVLGIAWVVRRFVRGRRTPTPAAGPGAPSSGA
jgi:hypothetical protein